MTPEEIFEIIEARRDRSRASCAWYTVWRRKYDRALLKGSQGRDASWDADTNLARRLTRDTGVRVSITNAKKWRQTYAPGWGNLTPTKIATGFPSVASIAQVVQDESDDPIPERVWRALLCWSMELCDYGFDEIGAAFGISRNEAFRLTVYARRQSHKWREAQAQRIINLARKFDENSADRHDSRDCTRPPVPAGCRDVGESSRSPLGRSEGSPSPGMVLGGAS